MSDDEHVTPSERGARLGAIVIDLLRLVRQLRAEYRALSELLAIALDELRHRDQALDRARATAQHLRERIRQLRTEAAARQGGARRDTAAA